LGLLFFPFATNVIRSELSITFDLSILLGSVNWEYSEVLNTNEDIFLAQKLWALHEDGITGNSCL
jgi:hypothetical protein